MSDTPPNEGDPDVSIDEAIVQAVEKNDTHTLAQLLARCKLNPPTPSAPDQGMTALHIAASRPEYKKCLELLLEQGAGMLDLNAKTATGETALHIACEQGCEENVLLLLQKGCSPSKLVLTVAAELGHAKIVGYLLEYLVDADGREGLTALEHALYNSRWEVFRILLQKVITIRSADMDGNLPLHEICRYEYSCHSRWFFEYADLSLMNHQNDDGITPFMYAVEAFDLPGVRQLLENGAKTDIYDNRGRGALHYATECGRAEVLQLLLQYTDLSQYKEFCLTSYPYNGTQKMLGPFNSLTCSAIASSMDCLDLLLTSGLPKSILQMPHVEFSRVYSPLVFLFEQKEETEDLESYVLLLSAHKVIMLDEFHADFYVKWPEDVIGFIHPFSRIVTWSDIHRQQHYFELLIDNGVTTDYCLQYYHDNTRSFDTFTDYLTYYLPVIYAVVHGNVETAKLLISNSVILEPDKVRSILRSKFTRKSLMYKYLTRLRPVHCVGELTRLYDSVISEHSLSSLEFPVATLQQLCRATIRQQIRERSLEENLRNFRNKISELPLPNKLKDFLLFKN